MTACTCKYPECLVGVKHDHLWLPTLNSWNNKHNSSAEVDSNPLLISSPTAIKESVDWFCDHFDEVRKWDPITNNLIYHAVSYWWLFRSEHDYYLFSWKKVVLTLSVTSWFIPITMYMYSILWWWFYDYSLQKKAFTHAPCQGNANGGQVYIMTMDGHKQRIPAVSHKPTTWPIFVQSLVRNWMGCFIFTALWVIIISKLLVNSILFTQDRREIQ